LWNQKKTQKKKKNLNPTGEVKHAYAIHALYES